MEPRMLVDLRSDTVTRPTPGMIRAMTTAELGDDVFGDDPTVTRLEANVAALLQKDAAVFVPSGTMANQLALRAHLQQGDAAIVHRRCHIMNYESGAPAALWGVTLHTVDSDDGSLDPGSVLGLSNDGSDAHFAPTRLVCFENTHNACGGRVVAQSNVEAIAQIARQSGMAMHLDGARLWNAAAKSGLSPAELAASFDTVSVCFSKGLGAPMGSVLAGSSAQIARARRFRKMLGGGLRQVGIVAAAAQYALDHHRERLADDHRRAQVLAAALAELPGVLANPAAVDTNLVFFALAGGHPMAEATGGVSRLQSELRRRGVLLAGAGARFRVVTHLDVDDAALDHAISAFRSVFS
jgi:threonine aldolase